MDDVYALLKALCRDALQRKDGFTNPIVTLSRRQPVPDGFPKGTLIHKTDRGDTYEFNPQQLQQWLDKNEPS